ncbi:MAG: polysaccharide biosynthesis protein, partial [Rhodoferax sp.]
MKFIRRNIIANYLGQGWTGFMAVAFLPLYVQYLGVEAYGLIGLFAVLQALVAILDMGIGNTLNKEMASFAHGKHSAR